MSEDRSPAFVDLFDRPPSVEASAPGRVNLIGEHTDYNDGFVLPIATPQQTTVALARRTDAVARVWTANAADDDRWCSYELGREERTGTWRDYVAGVTAALREHGETIGGFDARIASRVPLGAGLSSSASLTVSLLRALVSAFSLDLDAVRIAQIAQRAETGLVGAPVGIMDHMAASLADAHDALFLDTRTLAYERLPLPAGTHLIVIHSGVTHRHAGGEYRTRRAECDEAARLLGVRALRDVSIERLPRLALPPPLDRRVRHVVTENARVIGAREALRCGDAAALGTLMSASHASMRDDFEVSTPEIDRLVALAQDAPGVWGARLTGGGFGGSIVALSRASSSSLTAEGIAAAFRRQSAACPAILIS